MIRASCICSTDDKSLFSIKHVFPSKPPFEPYAGMVIGRCSRCGMQKTLRKNRQRFDPMQSRGQWYLQNEDQMAQSFAPLISMIKKHVPLESCIVDVGCSSGILLTLLQKEGYTNLWGIEPNKKAYLQAKRSGLQTVFHGTLEGVRKKLPKQADLIIYNHVLEHVPHPQEELNLAKKLLSEHGQLLIGVPNRDNIVYQFRGMYWESLMPLEHIWHFSTLDLENMLKSLKFSLIQKQFDNHTRSDYPPVKRLYFTILTGLNRLRGTGEAVTVLARKK